MEVSLPSGAVAVKYGANKTFTIKPNTSYHVANVLVDGVSVGAVTTYTFSNVTANHTISATFAIKYPHHYGHGWSPWKYHSLRDVVGSELRG